MLHKQYVLYLAINKTHKIFHFLSFNKFIVIRDKKVDLGGSNKLRSSSKSSRYTWWNDNYCDNNRGGYMEECRSRCRKSRRRKYQYCTEKVYKAECSCMNPDQTQKLNKVGTMRYRVRVTINLRYIATDVNIITLYHISTQQLSNSNY